MRPSRRRLSRKSLLTLLFIGSALAVLLLPRAWTGRLVSLVQVLVPFQDGTLRAANAAGEAVDSLGSVKLSREEWDATERRQAALEHQLAAMAIQLQDLQRDYEAAAGVRRRGLDVGRLIPARVVGDDVLTWRQSRLINAGTLSGVKEAAPVASDYFTIGLPETERLRNGLSVLSGEVLIGFVDGVGTHAARVRLVTDRATKMPVSIARRDGDRLLPLEAEFWLEGGGKGLTVRDVDHRYVKSGAIQEGDIVVSVPYDTRLPVSVTVGTIVRVEPDQENALLYTLIVEPALDLTKVRKVFVVDPVGKGQDDR